MVKTRLHRLTAPILTVGFRFSSTYKFMREKWFYATFITFIYVNLGGCMLPVITPDSISKKPFEEEVKASLRVGTTTREEVENAFGTPNATRRQSSIYVYSRPKTFMKLLSFDLARGFIHDFDSRHLLIVQFDRNGIVKNFDHVVGNDSETLTGIYVADTGLRSKQTNYYGTFYPPSSAPVSEMLVFYAPVEVDANVKKFMVPQGKSAIFLYCEHDYLEWLKPENAIIKVSARIDGIDLGDFGPKGFFYLELDPGDHFLAVRPIYPNPQWIRYDAITASCIEGQITFVELTWEMKGFIATEHVAHLNIITDPSRGRNEILKRRMILDSLTPPE
jgi:hypothetical protein